MSLVRNSIQYFPAVKLWKNRLNSPHNCDTLAENITYEKYVPVSHTYNSPKCVTCNTSDQLYPARDKFDRKLPWCKNNSTELFLVVTYLTKYMTCKKSDRISHTYISPKMFRFIKNLFTCVQAIEILMCDKLVWVKNSKSAKRILHLCPNAKNSVEFITPAWGIRSVRNTVQHSSPIRKYRQNQCTTPASVLASAAASALTKILKFYVKTFNTLHFLNPRMDLVYTWYDHRC